MRLLPAGSDGILVEVADLDQALALLVALREHRPAGMVEVVPAARTVLVRFDPLLTRREVLAEQIRRCPVSRVTRTDGPLVELPVCYDGDDLGDVARLCGLSEAEVVRRHTAVPWTVAFTGFAPGFAYLAGGDPTLDVPRRSEPRTTVPAGSVALAGLFSGVYPRATPGGWQLIGRTSVALWDLGRDEPALLRPGMRVQFVDAGRSALTATTTTTTGSVTAPGTPGVAAAPRQALEVVRPGPLTVVEDLGRPGRAAHGLARSGAADRTSLRRANRLVGNAAGTPALEVATGGLRVRARGALVLAVAGAPAPLIRHTSLGPRPVAAGQAFALDDGEELQLGVPATGVLSYLAVRGGLWSPTVLGSAATDLLAGIGPDPLAAGDLLVLGNRTTDAVPLDGPPPPPLPRRGDVVDVDVLLGPRADWFSDRSRRLLIEQTWTVTPRSNRVGVRLEGAEPFERFRTEELPSEGMVPGAIQVPANGQPVVLGADHPVTGGYPVLACVACHHLALIAQAPVGCGIRFHALPPDEPG